MSGEARWATYEMESDFLPTDFVNCTGLRFCLANGAAPLLWVQNTDAEVDEKNHVYEVALEFNVPLLKDIPGFQDVSANLAGRRAKYSNFDAGDSWKIGLNWQIVDSVRFRGTLSSDFRAPNINNLYQPAGVTSTDSRTGSRVAATRVSGSSRAAIRIDSGNSEDGDGGPRVHADLHSAVQLRGRLLRDPVDECDHPDHAIRTTPSRASALASAPAYDSPFCTLAIRPIRIRAIPTTRNPAVQHADRDPQFAGQLGAAEDKGYDFQIDYNGDMWGGQFSFRHLANYQPTNSTLNTPASTFYTWAVQPHLMQTTFLTYQNSGWNVVAAESLVEQCQPQDQRQHCSNGNTQNYVDSSLDAYDVVDITVGKEFEFGESDVEAFLTVNNLLDESAPLFGSNSGLPGLFYPTLGFYDDMGRLLHRRRQDEVLIVVQQGG